MKTPRRLKVLNGKLGVMGELPVHDVRIARVKFSIVTNNIFAANQKLVGDCEVGVF